MNNMLDMLLGFDLSSQHVAAENYQLMNYGIGVDNTKLLSEIACLVTRWLY